MSSRRPISTSVTRALPFHFGWTCPSLMAEALNNLPIPPVRVLVNNRKVVQDVIEVAGRHRR